MTLLTDLDVEITAEPAEMRAAIDHLGDRERACLHRIHEEADVIDLREGDASS